MGWNKPITDRTPLDVQNRTAKGFVNYTDLNRIEGNTEVLGAYFGLALTVKKDWARTDFFTLASHKRILENISKVREKMGPLAQFLPPVPAAPLNTFEKFNRAEEILLSIYTYTKKKTDAVPHAGEMSAGDEIGVI